MFDLTWLQRYFVWKNELLVKGRSYYNRGAVTEVSSHKDGAGTHVHSQIMGTKQYNTSITFDNNGIYKEAFCSCSYYHGHDGEICKHIAALYIYLKNNNRPDAVKVSAAKDLLNEFFENIEAPINKRNINISYTFEYIPGFSEPVYSLSLKVGLEKLYVVKNLKEFIECIIDKGKLDFGKNFSFNTRIHSFAEEDKSVMDLLMQLYATERAYKSEYYSGGGGIFKGKSAMLNENLFIKLCGYIKDKRIDLKIREAVYENVRVETEGEPYIIHIKNDNERIIAFIEYSGDNKFLGNKNRVIFSQNKLYILDNNKKSYEFFSILRKRRLDTMEFENDEKLKFLSVIPQIIGEKSIRISEEITKHYINSKLNANLYLDKFKRGIVLKLEFKYEENRIDPFEGNALNPFIIRDYNLENAIVRLIEDAEFKVKDERIYLDDYDKVYLFFRDTLPALSGLCSIYYTDEVKNMYMGRLKSYRSYVGKRPASNLIDINIEIEGIDRKEIKEILRSIKEKKNYHRLKNGRILSLEGEETERFSNLLKVVELDEIEDNIIKLSKYRAVSVFENMRELEDFGIDNSEEIYKLIEKIKNPSLQNIEVPGEFKNILRDYQITGFRWMQTLSESGFAGILADDMGLGKTIQTITLIYGNRGRKTSIVVAPSSLVYNWENEIKKFAPKLRTLVVTGSKALRKDMISELLNYDIVITSYPLMRRDIELYEDILFDFCILDEAQHIKNPESINASSVKRINAEHRFALTGTPMENSIMELWSIFDFLMPGYLLSRSRFSERFERQAFKSEEDNSISDLKRIISPFILRRKKKDVLKELPDKIETKLVCELEEEQKKLYMAYIARAREEVEARVQEEGFDRSRIQILSMITRLRQICCHPGVFVEGYTGGSGKMELLEELLEELIEGEHRILLFSQFTSLLEIIRKRLDEKNVKYLYLDGTIPSYKRMQLVDSFNNGNSSIFLISLKAGGTGLNLTSADTVIHFDPWWNPAVEDQATDRAHRIGQENVVEVFKLITKDTIEEKIFELQLRKKEMIDAVIQEGETFISKLSEEEILDLFKIEL